MNRSSPIPLLLVGLHGHGRSHLRALLPLAKAGTVRLAGVCDRKPPEPDDDLEGHGHVPFFDDLDTALRRTQARITVLVTPIHTHLPLAATALEHGSHLLLEKPTTSSLTQLTQLEEAARSAGRACQIGFQSLGSEAIAEVGRLLREGVLGTPRGIGAAGAWKRTSAYYDRAPWAGRRTLDGHDVVDGALTNPFAHAVANALALADAETTAPRALELEMYRAHPIESDDTSSLRLRTEAGTTVTVAVTLCAPESQPPAITVHGDRASLTLEYTLDRLTLHRPGQPPRTTTHGRVDLMDNLVAHVRHGSPLLVPPERTRGFTHVLEAVRTAPDPLPVPAEHQDAYEHEGVTHRSIPGVTPLVHESARTLTLFSELGAAWAQPPAPAPTTEART
ncbi:Gfo/Idh/MocA family protein [Nocardiopsis nanhaiensis]